MKLFASTCLLLIAAAINAEVPKELLPGNRVIVRAFDSKEDMPDVFEDGATVEQLEANAGKNAVVEAAKELEDGVYSIDVQRMRQDWKPYAKPQYLSHVPGEWLQALNAGKDGKDDKPKPKPTKKPSKKDSDDAPGPFYELHAPKEGVVMVFWDTETTGLNVWTEDIIQIGAAARVYVNGKWSRLAKPAGKKVEDDEFMLYIKTEKKLSQQIIELTGISQETLDSEGREFPDVYAEFQKWITNMQKAAGGKPVWLIAHNGKAYDTRILIANERRRAKKTAGSLFKSAGVSGLVDTLMISRYFYKLNGGEGRGVHKLGVLYEAAFGETFEAHSALEDSRALARLMTAEPFSSAMEEFPLGCSVETAMADITKPREDKKKPKGGDDNDNLGSVFMGRLRGMVLDDLAVERKSKAEEKGERGWIYTPVDQQEVLVI